MNKEKIRAACDHTQLAVDATWDSIRELCDDGIKYSVASVCIPQSFVRRAKEYVGERLKICTVIGFPNGYSTTEVKVFECERAIENGADEIDMVINVGALKEKRYADVLYEINEVKRAAGEKTVKVIVECCLLTTEEKIKVCEIVSKSEADFIKTSTGFSTGGATREDVELFKRHVFGNTKIKAAGGISSLEDAETFMRLGAERLGTSRIVKIIKKEENITGY